MKEQPITNAGQSQPVSVFQTDSNHSGQVRAYSVLPQLTQIRRPAGTNLQQYKDLILQQTACDSWLSSAMLGVVRI